MNPPPNPDLPELDFSRLLLVCTGSAAASTMPQWLDWLRVRYPDLEVSVVLTRTAERFVTRQALAARASGEVWPDQWHEDDHTAHHVRWAEWAEAIAVYPATVHFMARLALGLADSPALLAIHCASVPVAVAPALPPGGLDSAACGRHWAALAEQPNVVLAPPVLGYSLTAGRPGTWGPPPLPEVLRLLVERRREISAGALPAATPEPAVEPVREPDLVHQAGTGLLRTTVHKPSDGGFRWRRWPGRLAPAPFRDLTEGIRNRLAGVTVAGPARLVPGDPDGDGRLYRVRGQESVAARVLAKGPQPELVTPLRELGQLLRALHDSGPVAGAAQGAPGTARLGAWLAGRSPRISAVATQGMVRRALGESRWQAVRGWYGELAADPATTLCHGAPGLGAMVLDPDTGSVDLLAGEDICLQPWYMDLGWTVGELVELKWQLGGDPADWQRLIDALFDGYGQDLGPTWNRVAVLRLLLHVHDFAGYVDTPGDWVDQITGFIQFLIDA